MSEKDVETECEESAKCGMLASIWHVLPQTPKYRSLAIVRDTIQGHKVIPLYNNIRFKVNHVWNCKR